MKREHRRERRRLAMAARLEKAMLFPRSLLFHGKMSVQECRTRLQEGCMESMSVGICARSGEFYANVSVSRFFLSGKQVKEACLLEKGWRIVPGELSSYTFRWLVGTTCVVRPVGQRGIESMRKALFNTFCDVPPGGVCEKAVQNLALCGLKAHPMSSGTALLA